MSLTCPLPIPYLSLTHPLPVPYFYTVELDLIEIRLVFNYEPSLLYHFDLQYSLFRVSTHQL